MTMITPELSRRGFLASSAGLTLSAVLPFSTHEAEAQAQAICMQTKDYERAYNAFVAKQTPVFEGN